MSNSLWFALLAIICMILFVLYRFMINPFILTVNNALNEFNERIDALEMMINNTNLIPFQQNTALIQQIPPLIFNKNMEPKTVTTDLITVSTEDNDDDDSKSDAATATSSTTNSFEINTLGGGGEEIEIENCEEINTLGRNNSIPLNDQFMCFLINEMPKCSTQKSFDLDNENNIEILDDNMNESMDVKVETLDENTEEINVNVENLCDIDVTEKEVKINDKQDIKNMSVKMLRHIAVERNIVNFTVANAMKKNELVQLILKSEK